MIRERMTGEAVRDLLRADRIALEQGCRCVLPEHLLLAYAETSTDLWYLGRKELSRCLPKAFGRIRRRPGPRSVSRGLVRVIHRAGKGGTVTSETLLSALLEEKTLRRKLRAAGTDPELLFSPCSSPEMGRVP